MMGFAKAEDEKSFTDPILVKSFVFHNGQFDHGLGTCHIILGPSIVALQEIGNLHS
jgi:hypothetical protein